MILSHKWFTCVFIWLYEPFVVCFWVVFVLILTCLMYEVCFEVDCRSFLYCLSYWPFVFYHSLTLPHTHLCIVCLCLPFRVRIRVEFWLLLLLTFVLVVMVILDVYLWTMYESCIYVSSMNSLLCDTLMHVHPSTHLHSLHHTLCLYVYSLLWRFDCESPISLFIWYEWVLNMLATDFYVLLPSNHLATSSMS